MALPPGVPDFAPRAASCAGSGIRAQSLLCRNLCHRRPSRARFPESPAASPARHSALSIPFMTNVAEPRISESLHDFGGIVLRSIINHQDFEVLERLSKGTLQCFGKNISPVKGRDDDRNFNQWVPGQCFALDERQNCVYATSFYCVDNLDTSYSMRRRAASTVAD